METTTSSETIARTAHAGNSAAERDEGRSVTTEVLGYGISDLGITEIILRDFDHSWEYYKFNLEERRDIISRLYNFVGIPVFAIATATTFLNGNKTINFSSEISIEIRDTTLLCLGVCAFLSIYGILQLFALAKESDVSRNYLSFLNNVRKYIGLNSKELRPFLKHNIFEAQLTKVLAEADWSDDVPKISIELDPHRSNTNVKPKSKGLIGLVKRHKGSYWRSASAIFIVASSVGLSFSLATAWLGLYLGAESDSTILAEKASIVSIGLTAQLISFLYLSYLFIEISGAKPSQK